MRLGAPGPGGALAFSHAVLHADSPLCGLDVLVVEDNLDSLDVLQQVLQFLGARVTGVATVEEARQRIAGRPPDVVVADIALGTETGADLLSWVRAQPIARINRIPIIAITGHRRYLDAPYAAAFADWLLKPLRADALCAAILRATPVPERHRDRRRA